MYVCGVCVPCIDMQKDVRLWSLWTLYLHAEGCTFVESVDLVFTPMNDVPFVEFKYLVFTCRKMYVCGVCVPCIYMQKDVRFMEFVSLVFTCRKMYVCGVCGPCIYSHE